MPMLGTSSTMNREAPEFRIRCKSKAGNALLQSLSGSSTFQDLKLAISLVAGIQIDRILVRAGFPPVCVNASAETLLVSIGIKSGDVVIAEGLPQPSEKAAPVSSPPLGGLQEQDSARNRKATHDRLAGAEGEATKKQKFSLAYADKQECDLIPSDAALTRKVVPANNSCLFTSVDFCLRNGTINHEEVSHLREIVADHVLTNDERFNDAVLGKSPAKYSEWIKQSTSWGGAIELVILSEHFNVEMDVVDVEASRVEHFGAECGNCDRRLLLIYDGIHYDPLCYEKPVVATTASAGACQTIFMRDDIIALTKALELAAKAKAAGQYTSANSSQCRLCCLVCGSVLVGTKQANEHALATGHITFDEH